MLEGHSLPQAGPDLQLIAAKAALLPGQRALSRVKERAAGLTHVHLHTHRGKNPCCRQLLSAQLIHS